MTASDKGLERDFKMEFIIPQEMGAPIADHLNIGHHRGVFVISFFEMRPPIVVGTEEEKRSQMESISTIQANCVARVTVTPDRMEEFLSAMNNNYKIFMDSTKKGDGK